MFSKTRELRIGLCHCSHSCLRGLLQGRTGMIRGRLCRFKEIPLGLDEDEGLRNHGCHFFADLHTEVFLDIRRPVTYEGRNQSLYTGFSKGADPAIGRQVEWLIQSMHELACTLAEEEFKQWLLIEPSTLLGEAPRVAFA